MIDIVFQENYAKRIEELNQMAAQQGFAQGRQTGWNEMFGIVMHLLSENEIITQEKVIELINQMVMEQVKSQESKNE